MQACSVTGQMGGDEEMRRWGDEKMGGSARWKVRRKEVVFQSGTSVTAHVCLHSLGSSLLISLPNCRRPKGMTSK